MSDKKFDPNLRKAMEEIRQILQKRDIAGHIFLASATHTEVAIFYEPRWSVLRMMGPRPDGKQEVRIKATPSKNPEDQERMNATVHMISSFSDHFASAIRLCDHLQKITKKFMQVDHKSMIGMPADSMPTKGEF